MAYPAGGFKVGEIATALIFRGKDDPSGSKGLLPLTNH
jgi:hypothetical protein